MNLNDLETQIIQKCQKLTKVLKQVRYKCPHSTKIYFNAKSKPYLNHLLLAHCIGLSKIINHVNITYTQPKRFQCEY